MKPPILWSSLSVALALSGVALSFVHCSHEVVAVDAVGAADGGEVYWWPVTGQSLANSDPWLVAHHDNIVEMHPRVLMLDFCNGMDVTQARVKANDRIAAIAEGSRYHGYNNPNSPSAFLMYQLLDVRDLTDQTPLPTRSGTGGGGRRGGGSLSGPGRICAPSSSFPVTNGAFDPTLLFGQGWAGNYGIQDPTNTSRSLTLCELFKQGVINELWIMVDQDAVGMPMTPSPFGPLYLERKQKYDTQTPPKAIPGAFVDTGYQPFPVSMDPSLQCDVTVRIALVRPDTDPSCDLIAPAIGIANERRAIPYLADNASAFFDDDFNTRYGAQFAGWSELVSLGTNGWCTTATTPCISYASDNLVQGTFPNGGGWAITGFVPGCGSPEFPPNARFQGDWGNAQTVPSRCEHYGMRDGDAGTDTLSPYTGDRLPAAYAQQFGSTCNGAWQVYLRQNIPGLNNASYDVQGSRMKNWWPFLFY